MDEPQVRSVEEWDAIIDSIKSRIEKAKFLNRKQREVEDAKVSQETTKKGFRYQIR